MRTSTCATTRTDWSWRTECSTGFAHYNDERPHQALGYATPREVYRFPESHGARPAKWELKSDRLRR
ncbi:MAG: integrase core domain-containing protein [Verrucomicrobiae bacterium]|nr:integrase core domain-containing protein [Verrucomicrobiae bacterium]